MFQINTHKKAQEGSDECHKPGGTCTLGAYELTSQEPRPHHTANQTLVSNIIFKHIKEKTHEKELNNNKSAGVFGQTVKETTSRLLKGKKLPVILLSISQKDVRAARSSNKETATVELVEDRPAAANRCTWHLQ